MLARNISKKIGYVISSLILFTAQLTPFFVFAPKAAALDDKVTICHATNSATNPYEAITVDESAVDGVSNGDHYSEHIGPVASSIAVAQALKDDHKVWGDIIPPVSPYHAGLNWTATGQAILNAGCSLTTVEVVKVTVPSNDTGKFNLKIKGTTYANNVGNGGTTGLIYVNPSGSIAVSETDGISTSLSDYTTEIACRDNNGTGTLVAVGEPTGASSRQITIVASNIKDGDVIKCVITNTHQIGTVKVVKDVINDNGGTKTFANFTFKNNLGDAQGFNATTSPDGEKVITLPLGSAFSITETEANSGGYATTYSAGCTGIVTTTQQTCTITNSFIPVIPPSLTLNKIVSNTHGGIEVESAWTLTATGQTTLSGSGAAGSSDVVSGANFAAGTYTLSETSGPSGYTPGSWTCTNNVAVVDNQIILVNGQTTVCSITNSDTGSVLRLVKNVINDNGGKLTADDFGIAVSDTSPRVFGAGVKDGSTTTYTSASTVNSNTDYVVSEQNTAGYTEGTWSCTDGSKGTGLFVNVRLDEGEDVTCTITNNDQAASIVATKIVCDDESLLPNWGATGGPNVSSTTAIDWVTKNAGCKLTSGWNFEYALNNASNPGDNLEVGGAGWTAFGPTDSNGQTSTQLTEVSNIDRVWLREQLKEGYLEFSYNESESGANNSNSVSAEFYCNEDVLNYDNYDYIDNPTYGNSYYCVAWNVQQAKIRVHKSVTNDNGGTAKPEDFSFTVNGQNQQNFTNKDSYVELNVNPGSYTVSETSNSGYSVSYDGCENIKVVSGQVYNCYVTNNDKAPTLTVVKNVINDNGGNAKISDFKIKNNGSAITFGAGVVDGYTTRYTFSTAVKANTDYNLSEIDFDGYTEGTWSCSDQTVGSGLTSTVNLALGENVTCTITNNDQPATITLYKKVENKHGGTLLAADFPLTISGHDDVASGETVEINAGLYNVGEIQQAGYVTLGWNWLKGDCSITGIIKVKNGRNYSCTITNVDLPGKIVVHKQVINDNSGTKEANDFSYNVNEGNWHNFNNWGVNFEIVSAGTYNVKEDSDSEYEASYDGCSGIVVKNGEIKHCYITNNDIPHPSISVEKYGPATAYEGDEVEYSFYVTNDGDADLSAIDVQDNIASGMAFSYSYDGDNEDSTLEVGETWVYTAKYTIPMNTTENVLNTVVACADMYTEKYDWLEKDQKRNILKEFDELGDYVRDACDTDTHELDVVHPSVKVVKTGPATSTAGSEVTYTFTVTNSGDVPLSKIVVEDTITGSGVYVSGDVNSDQILDITETWIFSGKYTIPQNQITNVKNTVKTCGSYRPYRNEELSRSIVLSKDLVVCDSDSHTLGIPQVLGETTVTTTTMATAQKPAKLAVTGHDLSLNLVAGLVLITATVFVQTNSRTTKSTRK